MLSLPWASDNHTLTDSLFKGKFTPPASDDFWGSFFTSQLPYHISLTYLNISFCSSIIIKVSLYIPTFNKILFEERISLRWSDFDPRGQKPVWRQKNHACRNSKEIDQRPGFRKVIHANPRSNLMCLFFYECPKPWFLTKWLS